MLRWGDFDLELLGGKLATSPSVSTFAFVFIYVPGKPFCRAVVIEPTDCSAVVCTPLLVGCWSGGFDRSASGGMECKRTGLTPPRRAHSASCAGVKGVSFPSFLRGRRDHTTGNAA